ncbi:biotin/lipoyl-containing protein [Actinoallomurus sp. NPDC050550]|uniref:protein kinase domain-containing protein n=1 Tax=Actinoallomurus sp. NPDC050550 TaxID=3154937 RepID=UPI0033EB9AFF
MEPLREDDPRQVGPYRLEERLGGGGMGQVYLGRSRGGRAVAVKVVRPELADDAGFRRRFASEIAAARRVGGFYTAQVVQADPEAEPPWMASAYIPGPSLHQAVEAYGPLPPAAIGVLGAGLTEGLAAIHACDLVHRDLKPSNVILAEDGPRVIDFGIARALDATSHSLSRVVVGTPPFMSPEQARGLEVGPAGDVFSLGAVLVFALTGRSPFGAGRPEEVIYRVVHDEPDLSGLPAHLADLAAACLAKNPADRPSLTRILDRFAASTEATTHWLPSDVTAMITHTATRVPAGNFIPTVPMAQATPRAVPADTGRRVVVTMPRPDKSATEGVVTQWRRQEGDQVMAGEPLFEVTAGKGNAEGSAPDSGTLLEITVATGESAEVGATVAVITTDNLPPLQATARKPGGGITFVNLPWLPGRTAGARRATVIRWHKQVGDKVGVDDPLLEVRSVRGNTVITSPAKGILYGIRRRVGQSARRGSVIAVVGAPGATPPSAPLPRPVRIAVGSFVLLLLASLVMGLVSVESPLFTDDVHKAQTGDCVAQEFPVHDRNVDYQNVKWFTMPCGLMRVRASFNSDNHFKTYFKLLYRDPPRNCSRSVNDWSEQNDSKLDWSGMTMCLRKL